MDPCFEAVAGSLVGKAAESLVKLIARQLGYLFKHRTELQNLKDRLQELKHKRERMQQSVDAATWNGEEIFPDVNEWLSEVNGKISGEAELQWEADEEKANQRCFFRLCPNFKSRYQLSRKAYKEANGAIAQLLERAKNLDEVSYPPPPPGKPTAPPVEDKDYKSFESRGDAFDAIMAALKDTNLSIFGVHGMGGVGKTTLVKEVARQAKEEKLFDWVVLATITQKFEIRKIQDELAEQLGLKFESRSDHGRADKLRQRLMKKKDGGEQNRDERFLIILDDIWEALDLEAIGIPSYGAKYEGCKILMTSRELKVLSMMSSQKDIAIGVLLEEEAWNLFQKTVGDIDPNSDINSTAIEVARKCAGLPIAIVAVGKAMRIAEELAEWEDALLKLSKPSKSNFKGISGSTYAAIELSYQLLEDEEHQQTFLLCSIMGRDAAIEDLLQYGVGLNLYHAVNTVEQSRNRVVTLVRSLKNSSLLLDTSKPDCFDMHDVVRDVAISIASRDHHWLALLGNDDHVFEEWSDETMKNSQLISLQKFHKPEDSEVLTGELEWPNLTFFSVGGDEDTSLNLPNNFFKGMERLKVLGLEKMRLSSLPSSISFLKSTLCTLRLCDCDDLEQISIIGELTNLQILDLRRSKVEMLPEEIGQLKKLKWLNLSDCEDLKKISQNVLSGLSRLEELYLYNSFDGWEVDGFNARLVELQDLSHLTTLEVHIPNKRAIPKDSAFFEKLERFKISIGPGWKWDGEYDNLETSRKLKLTTMDKSIHLYDDGVKALLKNVDNLSLERVKDTNIVNMANDIQHLKYLKVSNVNSETICYGQPRAGSFCHLRFIEVENCEKLKYLFSFSIAIQLHQLEDILVWDCENMTELISEKNEEDIYVEQMHSSSQPESAKPNAMLLDQKVLFPSLKELKLGDVAVEKLWREHHQIMWSLKELTTLVVRNCPKLKHLFSSSMVNVFLHLKTLDVGWCRQIEDVITVSEERTTTLEFPKLQELTLKTLDNFKGFCSGNNNLVVKFPVLRKLEIGYCPLLKTFSTTTNLQIDDDDDDVKQCLFNEKVTLPKLEILVIARMESLERIWPNQLPDEESFLKLAEFKLVGCKNLRNVFPSSMLTRLQSLSELIIYDCKSVEEIIFEPQQSLSPDDLSIEFPLVKKLDLWKLPNLKSFSREKRIIKWPSLESMELSFCDKVEICFREMVDGLSQQPLFWVNKVSFHSLKKLKLYSLGVEKLWRDHHQILWSLKELTTLEIEDCPNLKHLFSSSMVNGFLHLETLVVQNCKKMEEVITGSEERTTALEFPKLQELSLIDLDNLKRFCSGNNNLVIKFPVLRVVKIEGCPVLTTFSTRNLQVDDDVLQCLFNEKVALPKLEILYIREMASLERIWPNQFPDKESFSKLAEFNLGRCGNLRYVFPLRMLTRLESLSKLTIKECESVEAIIFEPQQGSAAIQSLSIEFPRVKHLKLRYLPNLKSFSREKCTIKWPSLESIKLTKCEKVEIYFGEMVDGRSQPEIPVIQQPLFWVNELTFPKLESLHWGWNNNEMKEIWGGPPQLLASQYFKSLKAVQVEGFRKELNVRPHGGSLFQFLISIPNLERLKIGCANFEEIFQGDEEKPSNAWVPLLSRLTELELKHFPEMRNLWKGKEGVFQNLRILILLSCPKLEDKLVPSSISFQNLVKLEVRGCHGIKKLVTHQTAKSLLQLQEMTISDCSGMEEIIEEEDGDMKVEIHFRQLELLELSSLPRLESFCTSGNFTFQFPSLEIVIVDHCPKMKTFSQGELMTQMLHTVRFHKTLFGNDDWNWSGSLNETIQEKFTEDQQKRLRGVQREEDDEVVDCSELEEDDEIDDHSEVGDDEENSDVEDEETNGIKEIKEVAMDPKEEEKEASPSSSTSKTEMLEG